MLDHSSLAANLISRHPRFAVAGRGRYGLTAGAATMVELATKQWPDLTMAEFAAGLTRARDAAADGRAAERAAKIADAR